MIPNWRHCQSATARINIHACGVCSGPRVVAICGLHDVNPPSQGKGSVSLAANSNNSANHRRWLHGMEITAYLALALRKDACWRSCGLDGALSLRRSEQTHSHLSVEPSETTLKAPPCLNGTEPPVFSSSQCHRFRTE